MTEKLFELNWIRIIDKDRFKLKVKGINKIEKGYKNPLLKKMIHCHSVKSKLDITVILCSTPSGRFRLGFLIFSYLLFGR